MLVFSGYKSQTCVKQFPLEHVAFPIDAVEQKQVNHNIISQQLKSAPRQRYFPDSEKYEINLQAQQTSTYRKESAITASDKHYVVQRLKLNRNDGRNEVANF